MRLRRASQRTRATAATAAETLDRPRLLYAGLLAGFVPGFVVKAF